MQGGFPGFLDALLADDVGAAVVAQLAGLVQLFDVVLGDPADEADHVRRGLALRIFGAPSAHAARRPGTRTNALENQAASVSLRLLRSCRLA